MITLLYKLLVYVIDIIVGIVVPIWLLAAQLFIAAMIVMVFIPDLDWSETVYQMLLKFIFYPMEHIFYYFDAVAENVRSMDWSLNNPIEDGYYLMKLLFSIVGALALPVVYLVGWLGAFLFGIIKFDTITNKLNVMKLIAGNGKNPITNDIHMMSSHTTIQDTFDAEVQANAIAEALKK